MRFGDASRRLDDAISRRCHAVGVVSRRSNRSAFQSTPQTSSQCLGRREEPQTQSPPPPQTSLVSSLPQMSSCCRPCLSRLQAEHHPTSPVKHRCGACAAVGSPNLPPQTSPPRNAQAGTEGALVVRRGCLANDDEEDEVVGSIKKRHCEEPPLSPMDQVPVAFIEDLALSSTVSLSHTHRPCISK